MEPFKIHSGIVAPLDRNNVDTDCIIPKQFLRKIERTGFGKHLFHELRFLDYEGTKENPDFVLNQKEYRKATILLTRDNFGCGSSREHAPWALKDYGFSVIIAESFADIFYNNCFNNGLLLVTLKKVEINSLFDLVQSCKMMLTVDLEKQEVFSDQGQKYYFKIDEFKKHRLLKGLDMIGWTQQFEKKISAYENQQSDYKHWLC